MNIEKFKIWYEAKCRFYHENYHTIGFEDKDDWYCSPKDILEVMVRELEEFNTDTLAESA